MKIQRDRVTPYLAFIFIIVGCSGLLMFFHLMDDYTNVVHEFLGLSFFLFAVLHIITNWKSILNYKKRRLMAIPALVVLLISISLILIGKIKGNLERELLEKLVKAPVAHSFPVLQLDYQEAEATLRKNNIVIRDSLESIESISVRNDKSPEEIVEMIIQ